MRSTSDTSDLCSSFSLNASLLILETHWWGVPYPKTHMIQPTSVGWHPTCPASPQLLIMKFGIKTKYLESSQGGMDKGNITSRKKTRHTQTFKRKMSRLGGE